MQHKQPSFRLKLAKLLVGTKTKDFIPQLSPFDGFSLNGGSGIQSYATKGEQLGANMGWVFVANTAIADPCAAVEMQLFRKKPDGDREEVKDHPLLDLFTRPNFAHTGEQLLQLHYTYMNLVGESYILMMKGGNPFIPSKGQLPDALQIIPSHQAHFKLGTTYTSSTIKYNNVEYPLLSFIRDINPDPGNPYSGRSIIAAAAATIDTENQMKNWSQSLFANNARPSLVATTKEEMGEEAFERFKQQFKDIHAGTDNAYSALIIEGADVKPYMLNSQELDFLNSRKFSRDEILSMFRVSPGIIGSVENVNRSNLDAGMYIHSLINIVPRCRQFYRQVNATLVSTYDPTLELDFKNPIPEDEATNLAYAKAAAGNMAWLTIDEIRDMYGEKPLPDGLGAHVYLPGKTATADEVANEDTPLANDTGDENAGEAAAPDVPPPAEDAEKSLTGVKKKSIRLKSRQDQANAKIDLYTGQASGYQKAMRLTMRQQFTAQQHTILANANAAALAPNPTKKQKQDFLAALILWQDANDSMRKALQPIIFALIAETGKQAMTYVDQDPSQFNPSTVAILNWYQARAAKIAKDVNSETEKQLRASLGQGIDAGETHDELGARIGLVMGAALSYRADRIATTETTRAQGFADIQAWTQAGNVTGKEWAVQSGNPCPFCLSLDGVIVSLDTNFLSLGDVVNADGKTMNISYEDIASPPVHANCACALMPVTVS